MWDPRYHTPTLNADENEGSVADGALDDNDGSWVDETSSAAKDDSDGLVVKIPASKMKGKAWSSTSAHSVSLLAHD
jgi:hypothetical protein